MLRRSARINRSDRWVQVSTITAALLTTALLAGAGSAQGPPGDHPHRVARVVVTITAFAHRFDAKPGRRVLSVVRTSAAAPAASDSPPRVWRRLAAFSQCPPDGQDTSCGVLVSVGDSGTQVQSDPGQGPLDGIEDTLIGVQNSSSGAIGSLLLSANTDLFGFDADGLCAVSPHPAGCPFGPTGYEGPGTSFTNINPSSTGGIVDFSPALAPGQSAYFSLEEALTQGTVFTGGPSTAEQGAAPNPAEHPVGCSTGAPVNCATGTFWHRFDDLTVPGRGVPLDFQRTYSSAAASVGGPLGYGWTDNYGMSLSIDATTGNVTVTQEDGATVTFSPDGSGGYVAPPRVLATLVKNGDGSFTFTRNADLVQFTFSAAGLLQREVDRNGYATTLSYSGSQLASVTDPAGRSFSFGYSGSHIASVTGPGARQELFTYDAAGNLATAQDPTGGIWRFGYDASHRLTTMSDPRNDGSLTNHYDPAGKVDTQTDELGANTTRWSYSGNPASPSGGTTTVTDPNGNVTTLSFQNLELLSKTEGAGTSSAATTSYVYDPATLGVTQVTDPRNNVSTASYDSRGNQLTFTDQLNRKTMVSSYNPFNEPLVVTDPSNVATTRSYDGNGNLLSVSRPLDATRTQAVTYHYDDAAHPGDVTNITDPNAHTTSFGYDDQGDLASVTDAVGDKTTFTYNANGERTSMVSPRGNAAGANPADYTTSYVYDALSRLKQTTDPLGHITKQSYDAAGNLSTTTDGDTNPTQYTYDADNRLIQITRADATTLKYGYDGDGNQVSQSDGANQPTTYGYDPLDRVSSVTDPLNRKTSYGYDGNGNLTSVTDPSNRTTSYGYDAANELQSIGYSDGTTPNVSFTYLPDGMRETMSDGTGTTTYSYDQLNRLSGQSNPTTGISVGYGYDLAGNLTSITYPNRQLVTRGYDDANRLHTISDWLGHTTTFTPDPDSNTAAIAYANGVTSTSTFDSADQLANITVKNGGGTTLAGFGYSRDGNGQLLGTTPSGTGQGSNETYTYNPLNQLATVNGASYSYDAADNITKLTNGATLGYDTANELKTYTPSAGAATSFNYDQQGNRTNGFGGVTLGYDQASRLVSASSAPGSSAIEGAAEDGFAVRTSDGTVWGWGYNGNGQLGNGTTTGSNVPVQATGLTGATAVSAGAYFTLALKADGTVSAWGDNFYGQLGNGTTTQSTVPVQTSGLTGAVAVAGGHFHALALKNDGTVWAWGRNDSGQLGNGTTTNSSVPVKVSNLAGVTAIAAGGDYSLALKSDGTVWAWGANDKGQLGDNSTSTRKTPVQVRNLTGVHAIAATARPVAAGTEHSLALKSDGTVWAWGYNANGQLGNGTTRDSHVPVQVKNLTGAAGVAAGADHSLAVKSDGTVWAWGYNLDGELGNGTTTQSTVPVQVSGLSGVSTIAAGDFTSYALDTDGSIRDWGYGGDGELGNGATTNSTTPTQPNDFATPTQTSYTYDGDGLRATSTTSGTTLHFAWNVAGSYPLTLSDGSANYIYDDGGLPVEQIDGNGTPLYYQHDQLGSTRLLTNQAGNTVGTYLYNASGDLSNHSGSADTPLRWGGEYQDAGTGLYYLRARYYDPVTVQFLSRDPIAPLTQEPYGYAVGNPLNNDDPMGLAADCTSGGIGEFSLLSADLPTRAMPPEMAALTAGEKRQRVVAAAEAYLGFDYAWGGGNYFGPTWGGHPGGPRYYGFDCSGLVMYAYAQIGIYLPHYSGSWGDYGRGKSVKGRWLPGDLVFFEGQTDPQHVAIYIGGGRIIEAPQTGEQVRITLLANKSPVVGVRRLIFP